MTDPENQPNQFGVEFLMHGPKFAFKVGVQQFTLDYEPEEPGEFEFMRDALIHAFSTFPPNVKAAQPADVEPVYWEYKHVDDGPDDWQRVVPRTMQTLEVALAEIQGYRMGKKKLYEARALYTHPPARVPLSDEQMDAVIEAAHNSLRHYKYSIRGQQITQFDGIEAHVVRETERAHNIKG